MLQVTGERLQIVSRDQPDRTRQDPYQQSLSEAQLAQPQAPQAYVSQPGAGPQPSAHLHQALFPQHQPSAPQSGNALASGQRQASMEVSLQQHLQGMSIQQIAAARGLTTGTIVQHLADSGLDAFARLDLQRLLRELQIGPANSVSGLLQDPSWTSSTVLEPYVQMWPCSLTAASKAFTKLVAFMCLARCSNTCVCMQPWVTVEDIAGAIAEGASSPPPNSMPAPGWATPVHFTSTPVTLWLSCLRQSLASSLASQRLQTLPTRQQYSHAGDL